MVIGKGNEKKKSENDTLHFVKSISVATNATNNVSEELFPSPTSVATPSSNGEPRQQEQEQTHPLKNGAAAESFRTPTKQMTLCNNIEEQACIFFSI